MNRFFSEYIIKNRILIAFLVILLLWILFNLSSLIFTFFIAYIVMAALTPFVSFLEKRGFPQIFAIIVPYLLITLLIIFLIFPFYSIFSNQFFDFIKNSPRYIQNFFRSLGIQIQIRDITSFIQSTGGGWQQQIFSVTRNIVSSIVFFGLMVILSIYLLFYNHNLNNFIVSFFPNKKKEKVKAIIREVNSKFGSWFRGEIILALSIGVLVWISLTILGIEFAFPLAILAGLLEFIPTIGPVLAAIPPFLIAFSNSPTLAELL